MNFRWMNSWLFIFWLIVGVTLLFRETLMPGRFAGKPADQLDLLGYGAFALAGWNMIRVWSARSARRRRELQIAQNEEYQRKLDASEVPIVRHPEFRIDAADMPDEPPRKGDR